MADVRLYVDTKELEIGFLSPLDAQIQFAVIDLFYAACLYADHPFLRGEQYFAVVESIEFSNPFDIWAYFKNVTKETASAVLERTLFFKAESDRRALKNDLSRQEIISKKLENLERAVDLRQKMISGGASPDEANELVGKLLSSQRSTLRLESRKK